jgi:glycosyltransferase involved in cell wall biosynthesis
MIEAMSCGTPTIAFSCGSVPEVLDEGITGFVVNSEEEAVRALKMVAQLDRRKCRTMFDRRFTDTRMAEEYFAIYEKLLNNELFSAGEENRGLGSRLLPWKAGPSIERYRQG